MQEYARYARMVAQGFGGRCSTLTAWACWSVCPFCLSACLPVWSLSVSVCLGLSVCLPVLSVYLHCSPTRLVCVYYNLFQGLARTSMGEMDRNGAFNLSGGILLLLFGKHQRLVRSDLGQLIRSGEDLEKHFRFQSRFLEALLEPVGVSVLRTYTV